MMETAACLECDYECGSPKYLPLHYKMKHKDKISKCACGDDILSGICLNKARSKARRIASKCSSSSFSFSPNSISNLRSSFTDSNSDSASNSNFDSSSNSSPTSNSSFTSNSNPTSNSSFTSNSSHTSSFTNNKTDLTNKVCNRCGVAKQITSFDKNKAKNKVQNVIQQR